MSLNSGCCVQSSCATKSLWAAAQHGASTKSEQAKLHGTIWGTVGMRFAVWRDWLFFPNVHNLTSVCKNITPLLFLSEISVEVAVMLPGEQPKLLTEWHDRLSLIPSASVSQQCHCSWGKAKKSSHFSHLLSEIDRNRLVIAICWIICYHVI